MFPEDTKPPAQLIQLSSSIISFLSENQLPRAFLEWIRIFYLRNPPKAKLQRVWVCPSTTCNVGIVGQLQETQGKFYFSVCLQLPPRVLGLNEALILGSLAPLPSVAVLAQGPCLSDNTEGGITMVTVIITENCCHYYRGRVKTNRNYQFFCFW